MDAFPGRRVGPGRAPRPSTLDPRRDPRPSTRSFTVGVCLCPTTPLLPKEGSAPRKGRNLDFVSPARSPLLTNNSQGEFSLFHRRFSSPRRTDSTVGERLHCLPCWFVTARSGRTTTLDSSAKGKQLPVTSESFSCRVLTATHHQPPTSNTGPAPEPDYRRDCPIIGEIAHDCPRSKPRVGEASPPFGSFCHPLGEAFLALWGWGSPLVRFPPSPPTPFGARTGRRRCKPPASPHFGGFAEIKHHGGFFPLLRLFLDAFRTKRQPIESPHPRNPPS